MPAITVDPNLVYLILLFGLWMGVTAAYIPGTGLAEFLSIGISLAAIAILTSLPTNWLAVLTLVVGVCGFLIMPFINRRLALLAVGGLVLQAIGSVFLFNGLVVALPLITGTIVLSLVYHRYLLLPILDKQRQLPLVSDDDQIVGSRGRVASAVNPVGTVRAGGELWTARSDQPLAAGTEIIVLKREGLVLDVESIKRKREQLEGIEHEETES